MVNCSLGDDGLPSYEDTCSFTCNTGYELTGSDTRTCQSDGSWTGSDDLTNICRRGNNALFYTNYVMSIYMELCNPQPFSIGYKIRLATCAIHMKLQNIQSNPYFDNVMSSHATPFISHFNHILWVVPAVCHKFVTCTMIVILTVMFKYNITHAIKILIKGCGTRVFTMEDMG